MSGNRISAAAMVHLEKELGSELAEVLFNPVNTARVRDFCARLLAENPTRDLCVVRQITLAGIPYQILNLLQEDEECPDVSEFIRRSREKVVHAGWHDLERLVLFAWRIPADFHNIVFVFPNALPVDNEDEMGALLYENNEWVKVLVPTSGVCLPNYRVIRIRPSR